MENNPLLDISRISGKRGSKKSEDMQLMEECRFHIGDVVQHFKRENVNLETAEYLYRILAFAQHTENDEKLVIYQALYPPYKTCARPYDMFCSEVDREKYPNAKQKYRFEVVPVDFAEDILKIIRDNWEKTAVGYGLTRRQIEEMRPAFSACY